MAITHGSVAERAWDPPGPGTWTLDTVHVPRPATAHLQQVFPAFAAGFEESARNYGWLVAKFDILPVNGFLYSKIDLADLAELPERFELCAEAFATKRWRAEIARWDDEVKPAALARHADLLSVDVDSMNDDRLAAYLTECRDHHAEMWIQHHRFNGTHMIPVGDFIVSVATWTGLPAGQIAGLLRGASPISRGWCEETAALVAAIHRRPGATDLLDDADGARVLDRLRGLGGPVAEALDAWLLVTSYRPVEGFDITYPCGYELPNVMAQCIRTALRDEAVMVRDEELADVRSKVPAAHQGDFDERFAEARLVSRIRDERGIYSDAMACGIARRAFLAAGRRLAASGRLPRPDLALDATVEELAALLGASDGALVAALEARAAYRTTVTIADAPPFLGDPPGERPSFDGLPAPTARMMSALVAVNVTAIPEQSSAPDAIGERILRGVGASRGTTRGVARVVLTPDDFERLEDGDVLVTITTGEAFNVAIAMVSAVVTDQGNVMCHAAITSREFGIPAVVGTTKATSEIPDGAMVEVDGAEGTVRWS